MRRTLVGLMVMTIVIAGCSSARTAELTAAAPDSGSMNEEAALFESDGGGGADATVDVSLEVAADRQVIRRASLQLHASNTREAFDDIVAMVQGIGGFVADATVSPTTGEDAQPDVSMTLRVPADQLDATLRAIEESVDEVVSETQGAEDVTEQFVDLEAQLTNLEALEIELRALLQETRARENAKPEEILEVFRELTSVRGQIEQIQGQLNYLSDLAELATVQVVITQTPSAAPLVDEPWDPGATVRDAAGDLVSGMQDVADWLITFAISTLPLLVVVVAPLAAVAWFAYRRFSDRATKDGKGPGDPAPAGS